MNKFILIKRFVYTLICISLLSASCVAIGFTATERNILAKIDKALQDRNATREKAQKLLTKIKFLHGEDFLNAINKADIREINIFIVNNCIKNIKDINFTLELFKIAQKWGAADVVTYNSIITALGNSGQGDEALKIFTEAQRLNLANVVTYNSIITVLCNSGQGDEALKIFTEAQRLNLADVVTYNSIITVLCNSGQGNEALAILKKAKEKRLVDVVTYNSIITALGNSGQGDEALKIFTEAQRLNLANVVTYNSIITALGNSGQWDEALKIFKEAQSKPKFANVVTYNSIITVLGNSGQGQEALKIFKETQEKRLANVVTYSSIIIVLGNSGQGHEALAIFKEAQKQNKVDKITNNAIIDALLIAGKVDLARAIFVEIYEYNQFNIERRLSTDGSVDFHGVGSGMFYFMCEKLLLDWKDWELEPSDTKTIQLIIGKGLHSRDRHIIGEAKDQFERQNKKIVEFKTNKDNAGVVHMKKLKNDISPNDITIPKPIVRVYKTIESKPGSKRERKDIIPLQSQIPTTFSSLSPQIPSDDLLNQREKISRKDSMANTNWYTDDQINVLMDLYFTNLVGTQRMHAINYNANGGAVLRDSLIDRASVSNEPIAIPINIGLYNPAISQEAGSHWVGLYIVPSFIGVAEIHYLDPFGSEMPSALRNILNGIYPKAEYIIHRQHLQRDGYNCGPWVIEMLRNLVTGNILPLNFDINAARQLHLIEYSRFQAHEAEVREELAMDRALTQVGPMNITREENHTNIHLAPPSTSLSFPIHDFFQIRTL